MLLSAVSVLVVAQSSSKIPEGLTNNPVYSRRAKRQGFHIQSIAVFEIAGQKGANSPAVLHYSTFRNVRIQHSRVALRSYTKIREMCYRRQKRNFFRLVLLQQNVYRSELHIRKVQLSLPTSWMHAEGLDVYMEVRVQFHVPAVLFPQQNPGTLWTSGWVGPRAGLGVAQRAEKSLALTEIRKPDRPPGSIVTTPPTLYAHITKIILNVLLKAWR